MRILHLTIEGFGPFASKEEIDFQTLTSDGLFLIAGPTGAGKTSILDAICFALYGKVPGGRGQVKQLRSQFASPHTTTRVILDCEVRSKRFKIERSPSYERPKQRGTGMTTQPASVSYHEYIGGEWIGRSRRHEEVAQIVHENVGLNGDQFTRVMMLPQGEFSAFLRANATEREAILERLFGTERFGMVAANLSRMQSEANKSTSEIRTRRAEKITRFLENAHVPGIRQLSTHPSLTNVGAAATVAYIEEESRYQTAQRVNDMAQSRKDAAESRVEELRQRRDDAEHFLKHREVERKYDPEGHSQFAKHVKRMREAHRIAPAWDEYQRARRQANKVRAERDEAASPFDNSASELKELLDVTRRSRRAFSELEAFDARKTQLEQQLGDYSSRVYTLTQHVEEKRAQFEALDDPNVIEHAVDQAQNAYEDSTAVRDRVYALDSKLQKLTQKCERLYDQFEEARVRAQEARKAYDSIRSQRLAGIAGELAAELHDNTSCPVCGSTDHPSPAHKHPQAPGQADEDNAFDAMSQANERHSVLSGEYVKESATWEELSKQRQEYEQTAEIEQQCVRNQAEYRRFQDEHKRLTETRTKLRKELEQAEHAMEAMRAKQTDCEKERIRVDTQIEHLESETSVPESLLNVIDRSAPTRATQAQDLERYVESLVQRVEKSLELSRELQSRITDLHERESEWATAFDTSVFTEHDEFNELRSADLEDASHQLNLMEQHATLLRENHASDWYARGIDEPLTYDQLTERVMAQQRVLESYTADLDVASKRLFYAIKRRDAAHHARSTALEQERSCETELAHNERIVELAQIVNATSPSNAPRITLKSFVLGEMFAQVTQAASDRLEVMSRQRYRLEHAYERQTGQTKGGLLLKVVDTFTSEERDPRTLSGGESFMASLSLALGLADTVSAHAGGIQLDSLFIDEGFGSLDPQALDAVMTVLDELRAHGRSVGVISHVEEMQQSIPCKIQVAPSPTGSTTSIATGSS